MYETRFQLPMTGAIAAEGFTVPIFTRSTLDAIMNRDSKQYKKSLNMSCSCPEQSDDRRPRR